jgi:Protein of unknown function (DUF1810)
VNDSFDLQRFVDAQASIYRKVVEELSRGRKQTHWMWFIFPQIVGLGFSAIAQRFARLARRGRRLPGAWLARASLGRMHTPRHGCKRKARNRYSWLSGRHEIPVVHDAVRRRLEAGNLCRSHRRVLSRRERPCDFGNSGNEPIPIVIALQRPGTRPQLTCSFRRAQTNG